MRGFRQFCDHAITFEETISIRVVWQSVIDIALSNGFASVAAHCPEDLSF